MLTPRVATSPSAHRPTPGRVLVMRRAVADRGRRARPADYTRRDRSAGRNSSFALSGAPSTGVPASHDGILWRFSVEIPPLPLPTLFHPAPQHTPVPGAGDGPRSHAGR